MKLIRVTKGNFTFQLGKREKLLLFQVLRLYPRIPSATFRLSKSGKLPDLEANQRLLDESLAENLVNRSNVARMRINTDQAWTLLLDAIAALETERQDAILRVLEVKAAAAEMALEVTELAMRVCGGTGFKRELGVERHFRDARAAGVMAPTTDTLYDFLGRLLCGLPLF